MSLRLSAALKQATSRIVLLDCKTTWGGRQARLAFLSKARRWKPPADYKWLPAIFALATPSTGRNIFMDIRLYALRNARP
jgi:hypothetical protein